MEELGALLEQARKEQGISLAEMEEKTKIKQEFLVAIENGQFHKIPGEAYLKGFLRSYAQHVGLEPEDVLSRYNYLNSPSQEKIERSELRERRARARRQQRLGALLVLLTLAAYLIWRYFG